MQSIRAVAASLVCAVIACCAVPVWAGSEGEFAAESMREFDCRYGQTALIGSVDSGKWEHQFLPRDDVFRPLFAYSREPRFAGNFPWAVFESDLSGEEGFDEFIAAYVTLAESGGIWSVRREGTCDGFQVNVYGGVLSQFALNPLYLLNSDYIGGLAGTFNWGRFSARLNIFHQSSHIGDDFLLENRDFEATNLSFEAVDLVGSVSGSWWRVYGGMGYIFRAEPVEMDRLTLQAGMELRSQPWGRQSLIPDLRWVPVAGVDLTSLQARNWGPTLSTKAGVEILSAQALSRIRVLATLMHGYTPFGQFFDEHRVTSLGLEAQFMF